MGEDPSLHHGPEPDELEVGFLPSNPELVIPQIQRLTLTNRIIGFETLINITGDGMTPDIQVLLDSGVFPLVISQMNETNIKIIGLICTAARRLSSVAPQHFHDVMATVPVPFLLAIPDVPEVIDFLQESAFNFGEFAALLLSSGPQLMSAVGTWLQASEAMCKPALELLNTLSQIQEAQFDFACVKPFVDGQYSADIRALSINILIQVEPQNAPQYLQMLWSLFLNDGPSPTVIQIIHDNLYAYQDFFGQFIQQLYQRALQIIEVPESAILLADIAPHLDQASCETVIAQIFSQPCLCIERADAIFRICCSNEIHLPQNFLAQLLADFATNESAETLQCSEAIFKLHSDFFASPEVQTQLLPVFERDSQFSVFAFRVVLNCCDQCQVIPPLLESFHNFATQFEANFDKELHDSVAQFLASHQA